MRAFFAVVPLMVNLLCTKCWMKWTRLTLKILLWLMRPHWVVVTANTVIVLSWCKSRLVLGEKMPSLVFPTLLFFSHIVVPFAWLSAWYFSFYFFLPPCFKCIVTHVKQVMVLEKWHMFKDLVSCSFLLLLFPCCFLFFVMLSTVVDLVYVTFLWMDLCRLVNFFIFCYTIC